ncbi:hypothetical protein ABW20_dc0102966 [Dactylellina cionopaga]|nr:hypothetical protein ABW20_dc0102966 [Dactylellina cionopaga]
MRFRLQHSRLETTSKTLAFLYTLFLSIRTTCAQDDICNPPAQPRMVNSQAELDALSGCRTLYGDLNLGKDIVSARLNGIVALQGNLVAASSTNLRSLVAGNLSTISGNFSISDAPNLETLRMPLLAVLSSLSLERLPALKTLEFGSGVDSLGTDYSPELTIRSTGLESIDQINFRYVVNVEISDNPALSNIDLPLLNVTGNFDIRNNSRGTNVTLSKIEWINDLFIGENIKGFNAPKLEQINRNLVISSEELKSISFQNLTYVGSVDPSKASQDFFDDGQQVETRALPGELSKLQIVGSSNLTQVSFPNLTWITGGLVIQGSDNWKVINGFPILLYVGEDIIIRGNFSTVEFPNLQAADVRSTVIINSPALNCEGFYNHTIKKTFYSTPLSCNGRMFDLPGALTDRTPSQAAILWTAVGGGGPLICTALMLIIIYFRRKGHRLPWERMSSPEPMSELPGQDRKKSELSGREIKAAKKKFTESSDYNGGHISELEDQRFASEMEGQRFAPELEGHGFTHAPELDGRRLAPELEGDIPHAELEADSIQMVSINRKPVGGGYR